jgi:hypothetical protein
MNGGFGEICKNTALCAEFSKVFCVSERGKSKKAGLFRNFRIHGFRIAARCMNGSCFRRQAA